MEPSSPRPEHRPQSSAPTAVDIRDSAVPGLLYAEDLVVGQLYELGTTTTTESEIIEFATRYDPLPIHIDPIAAAAGPFAEIIGSATHSMALYSSLASQMFISRLALVAGKGVERLRFPNPLRPGVTHTASIEICDVTPRFRPGSTTTDRADLQCTGRLVDPDGRVVLAMNPLQVVEYRTPQHR